MKTNNCALWDAIGEYAETHHEFMSAPTQALEKKIREGESLYVAHEKARAVLTAIIGKRDDDAAQQIAKAEQAGSSSAAPSDTVQCQFDGYGCGSTGPYCAKCTSCWNSAAPSPTGESLSTIPTWQERMDKSGRRECESLAIELMEAEITDLRAALATPRQTEGGGVVEITDDQMIGVLHSFGIDTKLSVYGFDDLQVSGTNVPGIKGIVRMCIACIQSGVWPAPRYSFDSNGNVVRAASPAPTGASK